MKEIRCRECGVVFKAYDRTGRKEPIFCSSRCYGKSLQQPFVVKKGYKKILIHNHPRADSKGYVFEHIVILESIIGRSLSPGEECHHKDKNRLNNAPDNLEIRANHFDHMQDHVKQYGCIVPGCTRKHCAKGMCIYHYNIENKKHHSRPSPIDIEK